MNTLPNIQSYGDYKSENYGVNSLRVDIGTLTLFFSYKTVVAFKGIDGLKVRKNDWSTTTGKHLNWIDGGCTEAKKRRLESTEFEKELLEELERHGLQK